MAFAPQLFIDSLDAPSTADPAAMRQLIAGKASALGLDPALALSLAQQESGFNPAARSPTGVEGLLQVTNATGAPYGQTPHNRTNPVVSAHAGLSYFKDLLSETGGNIPKALMRYNGGSDPDYVQNVMRYYPDNATALGRPRPQPASWWSKAAGMLGPGSAEAAQRPFDPEAFLRTLPAETAPAPDAAVSTPDEAAAAVQQLRMQQGAELPPTGPDSELRQAARNAPQGPPLPAPGAPSGAPVSPALLNAYKPELEGNLRSDVSQIEPGTNTVPTSEALKGTAAFGIRTAGALGGGMAGTAVGGPVGGVAGTAGGGVLANRVVHGLGLEPEPTPLLTVHGVPVNTEDVLAVGVPVAGGVLSKAGQMALAGSRAGKAIGAVDELTGVIGQQEGAITAARHVAGKYAPDVPSWVLYDKFGQAAKNATVDMAPVQTAAKNILGSRPVLPSGQQAMLPAPVQKLYDEALQSMGSVDVSTIQKQLKLLGPLTRSPNGDIRGAAKQLYGAYTDALEQAAAQAPDTALARDLLLQANQNFRTEMQLADVAGWLKPGSGIVRVGAGGREQINVGALLTKFEKEMQPGSFRANSFTPEELTGLREDFYRLAGTPNMPSNAPAVGQAVEPQLGPRPSLVPTGHGILMGAGVGGGLGSAVGAPAVGAGAGMGLAVAAPIAKNASYLLAKGLLTPELRPLVIKAMAGGQIDPRIYGVLSAALQEKQAP